MATTTPDPDYRAVEADQRRTMRNLALAILALVLLAGVVIALMYERTDGTDPEAEAKAAEFVAALEDAGLQVQDVETVARIYGTDGGRACTMSGSDSQRNLGLLNAQKTGEVHGRPGNLDPRIGTYERTMIATYCPERLDEFDAFVDGLKLRRLRDAP